uniref:Uncharacterized protein n=1 Tax=Micrurus carvalhoi TaxID=3147026 RepID=A0A2H6N0Q0_9SAUR
MFESWRFPVQAHAVFLARFQKCFDIAFFLRLRESDWPKVTQMDLCLRGGGSHSILVFLFDALTTTPSGCQNSLQVNRMKIVHIIVLESTFKVSLTKSLNQIHLLNQFGDYLLFLIEIRD